MTAPKNLDDALGIAHLTQPPSRTGPYSDPELFTKADLDAHIGAVLAEAAHLMPRYFGVWSSTGVHIGVWDDGATAAKVLGEYPRGVMRDLVDVQAILA